MGRTGQDETTEWSYGYDHTANHRGYKSQSCVPSPKAKSTQDGNAAEFTCGFLQASGRGLTTHPYVVDIDLQRGFLSSLGPMGDQGSVGTGVAGDRQGELRSFS